MNGFFEVLLFDRTTIYIVWLLANFTKITPNQVSMFGALFIPLGAYFFWNAHLVIGAICMFINIFLDATDGKLARITNNMSKMGIIYEGNFDLLRVFLFILGLTFGYYGVINDISIFFWGFFALYSNYFFMFLGIFTIFKIRAAEENPKLRILGEPKTLKQISKSARVGLVGKLKTWLNERRLELQFITTEQEMIFFIIFPLLAVFFGFEYVKYGFITGSLIMIFTQLVKYYFFYKRNKHIKYERINP